MCIKFCSGNLNGRDCSKLPVNYWYPSIQNSYELANISKKTYHFTELLEKQSYDVHMFTSQAVVLPATTRSAACHPPSCRCQYTQSDA
jgi:hypothetical protein